MEADWLRSRLEAGRSIESIAREAGKHPSTVGYWVNQHGLTSLHAARHAARGEVSCEELERMLAEGLAIRAMAERLGRSYTSVRHWLARHGLATPRALRLAATAEARAAGAETVEAACPVHGPTLFVRRGADGFRCRLCRSGAVDRRRKEVKRILVAEAGGSCALCGYDRSMGGLHFHHRDPAQKAFALSARGMALSLEAARAEAAKCVLLCSNCHAEVEAGLAAPP
jgi:transposase-like protein